jgi:hypothetical protein
MSDLITSARAKYSINQASFSGAEDTTIAALVTAVSKAIQKYCRRDFASATYDELYNGTPHDRLLLRQFPILSVQRVAYGPTPVLRIKNTSSSNQRATVSVTSTGLTLVRVASGTTTTDTSVTWAGNATLSAVATAVNALGNGWSAQVIDSTFNNRASADLRAILGAYNVANNANADLRMHINELSSFGIDANRGWLLRDGWEWFNLFHDDSRVLCWDGGPQYWRVIYTAGFATVPDDVQEAAAEWVAALFWTTKRDPGLTHEAIPNVVARTIDKDMPAYVRTLLDPYKDRRPLSLGG